MSHSNRTSLPEGYLWGWAPSGERRPVSSADPSMAIQPPTDQSYMPNVTTTPTPPGVWMASAGGSNALQVPPSAAYAGNPLAAGSPGGIQTVGLQGQPGSWQWHVQPLGNEYRIFGSPPESDKFQLMGREGSQEQALKRMEMLKNLLGGGQ